MKEIVMQHPFLTFFLLLAVLETISSVFSSVFKRGGYDE